MARSVFDLESEDRVESPEKLNEYIRVAEPGVWAGVLALVLVLAAFIAWGFIGRVPESVNFRGVVDKNSHFRIDVFVDASQYTGSNLVGKEVTYELPDGKTGKGKVIDSDIMRVPLSRDEIKKLLVSDFLVSRLVSADYTYIVQVEPQDDLSQYSDYQLADVMIITDEIQPIQFLLK